MAGLSRGPGVSHAAAIVLGLCASGTAACSVDGDECIADCRMDGHQGSGVAFVKDTDQGPGHTESLTASAHASACFDLCRKMVDGGKGTSAAPSCQERCLRQSTVEIRCQRADRLWVPHFWTGG